VSAARELVTGSTAVQTSSTKRRGPLVNRTAGGSSGRGDVWTAVGGMGWFLLSAQRSHGHPGVGLDSGTVRSRPGPCYMRWCSLRNGHSPKSTRAAVSVNVGPRVKGRSPSACRTQQMPVSCAALTGRSERPRVESEHPVGAVSGSWLLSAPDTYKSCACSNPRGARLETTGAGQCSIAM
jgi:hypothetical protein